MLTAVNLYVLAHGLYQLAAVPRKHDEQDSVALAQIE